MIVKNCLLIQLDNKKMYNLQKNNKKQAKNLFFL